MCGRFTNRYTWRDLVDLYRITEPYVRPISNLEPRFNFAPMQSGIVVRLDGEGRREPVMMRWGLVPAWSKDEKGAARCINAKSETVAEKPSYRQAFKFRPCLVPADGFYEWSEARAARKQPYFFRLRGGGPFAFAGLWESWKKPDGSRRETFTIITTAANALCAPIHDRMPLILPVEDWEKWLGSVDERKTLLTKTIAATQMKCWPVGKAVGSVRNESPHLAEPVKLGAR